MTVLLTSLPEELLERIIALAIEDPKPVAVDGVQVVTPQFALPRSASAPFPCRLPPQSSLPRTTSLKECPRIQRNISRYTPLLSCSLFARIGTAVLYTHIHLRSRAQCSSLAQTLSSRADLAWRVRTLRIEGAWPEVHDVISHLKDAECNLDSFDMVVCAMPRGNTSPTPSDVDMYCEALAMLPSLGTVKSLTVRKAPDVYLTLPGAAKVLECLSDILGFWQSLETVNIGFRLPSGPRRTLSSPLQPSHAVASSPSVKLVSALARSPSLKTVSAQLPAAWNSSLLEISANPSLDAIRLEPSPPVAGPHHLFLMEARKYPRLAELIQAGSPPVSQPPIIRKRSESASTTLSSVTVNSGRLRANTTLGTSSSPTASTITFPTSGPSSIGEPSTSHTPVAFHNCGGSANTPVERSTTPDGDSVNLQRQLSRRRSGKGHTRQSTKWSRRISIV